MLEREASFDARVLALQSEHNPSVWPPVPLRMPDGGSATLARATAGRTLTVYDEDGW